MKGRLFYIYSHILVFLGFKVWVKEKHCRPKFQVCAFHSCKMKRQRKTEFGAFYYCPKCKRSFHLEGGGIRLVPLEVR